MSKKYDCVVIGAGSGGLTAAVGLRKVGRSVLLVEREHLGGECTNSGCIPSKALLHHAKSFHNAITISGHTDKSEQYRKSAFTYVNQKINEILAEETPEHFSHQGIDVVLGEAVFSSRSSILVGDTTYEFKKAIIATGSKPRPLSITGLTESQILTNQNIFNLESVPEKTLVIGGGPIGMEMGQALALLGSQVTIIENGHRFAKLEDETISPIITKAFSDLDINIITNATVKRVDKNVATIEKTDQAKNVTTIDVTFDKVLVAIGRVPNIPEGLNAAGVTSTEFGINVDSSWRTSNKHIYALGDVAARLKFTHVADDTARQVITHIVSFGLIKPKEKIVPKVTYTEPEIAQVGLSWEEAKNTYSEDSLLRIEVPLNANDRARTDSTTEGILVVIAKRISGTVIGANMIGPRAGEIIGTITLAIENNISLYRLRSTIFAYPTYSLILKRAGDYFLAAQFSSLKTDLLRMTKSALPKVLALGFWLLALYTIYDYKVTYGFTVTELSIRLFEFITSTIWGPVLYVLAYTIRPLTFFPGTALTILSGIFFGLWGIIYTIIGANLSAALAYSVGRFFSTEPKNVKSLLTKWTEPLRNHPFLTILTMRLTFFPFDVVNYGAGLFRTPFAPYIIATFIGTLLGITTFVSIGASLSVDEFLKDGLTIKAIDTTFIILSGLVFLTSLIVAKALKRSK